MTNIPNDVGLLITLRRVRAGRVFVRGTELWTEKARPFPRLLVPFVRELFDHGHIRVDKPDDEKPEQAVRITALGEAFLMELEATSGNAANRSPAVDDS